MRHLGPLRNGDEGLRFGKVHGIAQEQKEFVLLLGQLFYVFSYPRSAHLPLLGPVVGSFDFKVPVGLVPEFLYLVPLAPNDPVHKAARVGLPHEVHVYLLLLCQAIVFYGRLKLLYVRLKVFYDPPTDTILMGLRPQLVFQLSHLPRLLR